MKPHYEVLPGVQALDIIKGLGLNFNLGNTMKYLCRLTKKHPTPDADLEKAMFYLMKERADRGVSHSDMLKEIQIANPAPKEKVKGVPAPLYNITEVE